MPKVARSVNDIICSNFRADYWCIHWMVFYDESVPGKWTWLGGLILIIGIMFVIKGGAEHGMDTSDE